LSSSEVWQCTLLAADATLRGAISNLDASALQIAIVVVGGCELVGTVTDGDIRRGLLRGLNLDDAIGSIINREPLVVPPQLDREAVRHLMQANRIRQLPIVDACRKVVGLHLWDTLTNDETRANTMVLMAGGKGTRLLPRTENCPKPLLPVAGKPILEHIIDRAAAEGFREFIISVHYLGEMIEEYFGDGSAKNIRIHYVRERQPLGTAGALAMLDASLEHPLLVSNGDVLADIRYGEILDFHLTHHATATMAVRLYESQHPFGVVRTKGVDIVGFDEKPVTRTHVNAGIYVLDRDALGVLNPNEHCDMPTLFSRVQARRQRTIVYPMHEPWLDVGRPDDYADATNPTGTVSSLVIGGSAKR
jgi:dTDP-glucose pyrophosphorylase